MHGKLENRTIERLDEVICNLKRLESDDFNHYDQDEAIRLIGSAIELIPSVAKLIEYIVETWK